MTASGRERHGSCLEGRLGTEQTFIRISGRCETIRRWTSRLLVEAGGLGGRWENDQLPCPAAREPTIQFLLLCGDIDRYD